MPMIGDTPPTFIEDLEPDEPMLEPEEAIGELRSVGRRCGIVQLPNGRELRQMRRIANVNVEYCREAMNAIGVSEAVRTVVGNTADEMHQAEDELARWMGVEGETRSFLRGLVAANVIRRHRIGLMASQVYNVSRQLVRQPEHADLLPNVERMSRIKKFARRRQKPAEAPVETKK